MAQDLQFFDRLYQGFEAEYLVAAAMFGAGFEAFKLPGDFGFDLLVSNQLNVLRQTFKPEKDDEQRTPFPYAVQVKSRRARPGDIGLVDELGRHELDMTFSLKQDEYDKLTSSEKAFLVCVLFLPTDHRSLSSRPVIFWLKGNQLPALNERGYLVSGVDGKGVSQLTLTTVYRFVPMMKRNALIDTIAKSIEATGSAEDGKKAQQLILDNAITACRKQLADLLPEEVALNRTGKEYVSFRRLEWDKSSKTFGSELSKPKKLDDSHTDLTSLGTKTRIFPVDDRGVEHWLTQRN